MTCFEVKDLLSLIGIIISGIFGYFIGKWSQSDIKKSGIPETFTKPPIE